MRVLVTNDDGVDAPGIRYLAEAVRDEGHEVVVVAPTTDRSGAGGAIGPLRDGSIVGLEQRTWEGWSAPVVALDCPPALCVIAARLGAFGDPPEIVVSGINPGANTGRAIFHSGTVGAALTAANQGLSGLAVSVAGSSPGHWTTATRLAVDALGWLAVAEPRTVVNLNVPDLPLEALGGVCWARPAPIGERHAVVEHVGQDQLVFGLRTTTVALPADSDTALVAGGYAAVTLLGPVAVADWAPIAPHLQRCVEDHRTAEASR